MCNIRPQVVASPAEVSAQIRADLEKDFLGSGLAQLFNYAELTQQLFELWGG